MDSHIRQEKPIEKGTIFRYTGEATDRLETGQLCRFERESKWSGASGVRLFTYQGNYTNTFFVQYLNSNAITFWTRMNTSSTKK